MYDIIAGVAAVASGCGIGAVASGFIFLGVALYAYPAHLVVISYMEGTWLPYMLAPSTVVAGLTGAYTDSFRPRTGVTPRPMLYAFLASCVNVVASVWVLNPHRSLMHNLLLIDIVLVIATMLLSRALFHTRQNPQE
jgi:hypothetical protein